METYDDIRVTMALESDARDVWHLLHSLAVHEGKILDFDLTVGKLRANLWGPSPIAGAVLARVNGASVGVALHYRTFPSFHGNPCLFIEDLFVMPTHRRRGVGTALLKACAEEAMQRGCSELRWWALEWNRPAQAFYSAVGARGIDKCVVHAFDLRDSGTMGKLRPSRMVHSTSTVW